MTKLKFIGNWLHLKDLGYTSQVRNQQDFAGYWKGKPDFALWVWKSRDVVMTRYTEEETAMAYQYLVQNDFDVKEKCGRLVFDRETYTVMPFNYKEHDPMGIYGLDYTEEDYLKYRERFVLILLTMDLLSQFRELRQHNLIELSIES